MARAICRLLPDGVSGFARRSPSFWPRVAGAKSVATFTPEKLQPGSEAKLVLSEGRVGWSSYFAGGGTPFIHSLMRRCRKLNLLKLLFKSAGQLRGALVTNPDWQSLLNQGRMRSK
jgi:hypothetical protein